MGDLQFATGRVAEPARREGRRATAPCDLLHHLGARAFGMADQYVWRELRARARRIWIFAAVNPMHQLGLMAASTGRQPRSRFSGCSVRCEESTAIGNLV